MTEVIVTLDDKLKILSIVSNMIGYDKKADMFIVDNCVNNFLTLLDQDDLLSELQNRYIGAIPQPIKNINMEKYVRLRKQ